jgi:hypothetical protein
MTETAETPPDEVRAQARRLGIPVPDRGRVSAETRAAVASALAGQVSGVVDDQDQIVMDIGVPPAPDEPKTETPPPGPPPKDGTVIERGRKFWQKDKAERERVPKRGGRKRVSLETLGGLAWAGIGRVVSMLTPDDTYHPVITMMGFQSPVAGAVFEDVAKDTLADRIMQPIARLTESGSAVGALVGPPLLTAAVCRNPASYPAVRPLLMTAMREWVIVAGPKLREMRRREEKFAEEMGSFQEEFGVTVEELLDEVFRPVMARAAAAGAAGTGQAPA